MMMMMMMMMMITINIMIRIINTASIVFLSFDPSLFPLSPPLPSLSLSPSLPSLFLSHLFPPFPLSLPPLSPLSSPFISFPNLSPFSFREEPKLCFAATFVKGDVKTIDYYACKTCHLASCE